MTASTGIILSPSILSADWTRLREQIALAEEGADWLHLDVMDGQFVPNLTFGPLIVAAIRKMTRMPLDVHLMIHDPVSYAQTFRDAGADWISVHAEARGVCGPGWNAPVRSHGENAKASDGAATEEVSARIAREAPHPISLERLRRSLRAVRATGAHAGLALRPDTPVGEVEPVLDEIDLLIVMSVYPGFSGQPFRDEVLDSVRAASAWREERGRELHIEMDGGIARATIERAAAAGADVFVAGHGVYREPEPLRAMAVLKELAAGAISADR
jgi:ribulose-phosphate 3-epimerase